MSRRSAIVRTHRERLSRSEPFEVFTRPQRSTPARLVGLVVRLRAELLTTLVLLVGWMWLCDRLPRWAAGTVLLALVVAVAVWTPARRYVTRRVLAVMTRHRLRAVFVERRVLNYSGNLPVLLWCRPIEVGERVWLLLRAGIDLRDIEANLSYLVGGCWAADARATCHRRVAALVVLDVIRRDPLTGAAVTSPLTATGRRLRVVPPPFPSGGERHA